jgi:hypothetical protein
VVFVREPRRGDVRARRQGPQFRLLIVVELVVHGQELVVLVLAHLVDPAR